MVLAKGTITNLQKFKILSKIDNIWIKVIHGIVKLRPIF